MKDRCHLRARLWICGSRMLEAVPIISTLFRSSLCFRFHHEEGQNHNQKMFTCTCWYLLFLLQPWYMFWFRLNFTPGLARKWMCIYINKSVCVFVCAYVCARKHGTYMDICVCSFACEKLTSDQFPRKKVIHGKSLHVPVECVISGLQTLTRKNTFIKWSPPWHTILK